MANNLKSLTLKKIRKKAAHHYRVFKQPQLSIIIPVYNVEQYIAKCLDSVIMQDYKNLEIIVVDDGSPDGSHEIVSRYAKNDKRIRIIRKKNAGLGAARNTGIEQANGKYIAFLDSDDTLPNGALSVLMNQLLASGSDFVTGTPQRTSDKGERVSKYAGRVHAIDRNHIKIDEYPEIIVDTTSWNKIFKTKFFREKVVDFPVDVYYEDQPPMVKAFVRAESFDIARAVTYNWLIRGDNSSITQSRTSIRNITDRFAILDDVRKYLDQEASLEVYKAWAHGVFSMGFNGYYKEVVDTSDEWWGIFQGEMQKLHNEVSKKVDIMPLLGLNNRYLIQAAVDNKKNDVVVIEKYIAEFEKEYDTKIEKGKVYGTPRYLDDISTKLPKKLQEVQDIITLKAKLKAVSVNIESSTIVVKGAAYIQSMPVGIDARLSAQLVPQNPQAHYSIKLDVSYHESSSKDVQPKTQMDYSKAGFSITLGPKQLAEAYQYRDSWTLRLRYEDKGVLFENSVITNNSTLRSLAAQQDDLRLLGVALSKQAIPDDTNKALVLRIEKPKNNS